MRWSDISWDGNTIGRNENNNNIQTTSQNEIVHFKFKKISEIILSGEINIPKTKIKTKQTDRGLRIFRHMLGWRDDGQGIPLLDSYIQTLL